MVKTMTSDTSAGDFQDGRQHERHVERMDTSTIDAKDMDSLRTENDSTMETITQISSEGIHQHIKSEHNPHIVASQVYGQVEEAEIEKFLREHPPTEDDAHRRDIKVAELRRIIPLLIITQFNIRKDPTQKKVKGMWNEKPKNWPDDLPYCDPNNKLKGENGKPSQKVLLRMFSFLVKLYLESHGETYPEQKVIESPVMHSLTVIESPVMHSLTASGSPVAIDSRPYIKTESRDAMVLGTASCLPTTIGSNEINPVDAMSHLPSHHLQTSAIVTSAMSQPVTAISNAYNSASEQPKLHALLQGTSVPMKARNKTPAVGELLHQNVSAPQTLQQTIIIKPPPVLHHISQPGNLADQSGFVNTQQAIQAVQALQDGEKYLIQSFPVLTHTTVPVSGPISHVEPYPHGVIPPQFGATEQAIPANEVDSSAEPSVSRTNSLPMDIDPLSVLSATAAKKQPLPVPNSDSSSPTRPPPSHLHITQPASGQDEVMDTTQTSVPENTPVQVEEDDWDPFADLKQQCSRKLRYLEQKRYVVNTDTARLNIIKDLIDKMYMVRQHDPEFFLNTAHEFVSTLDIIKATGKVPPAHMNKWREFEGSIKERLLHVLRIVYPRVLQRLEQNARMKAQHGAWFKAITAQQTRTPKVVNEEEVQTAEPESSTNSAVNLAELGITPVTPVTVGTMEQLQIKGELNLRIIHDNESTKDANPEVEAIKKDLKLFDEQMTSPRSSIDGQHAIKEPETPGSTTSEQHLEDLQQVLIMDSIKDAINKEQKQKVYYGQKTPTERDASTVSSTMYASMEKPEMSSPMMNYRNPSAILVSPRDHSDEMSPTESDYPLQRDEDEPMGKHWTQLNVQPPGSREYDAPPQKSIAAELLEEISAQGIGDKGMLMDPTRSNVRTLQGDKIRGMANAYINLLANGKMADYGDDQTNSHCDQASPGYNVVPTVVDEVQNVFEKSDMLGPPPPKRATKRPCSEQTVY